MRAYNFKRLYAPLIKAGTKRSTIRARRKDGYVPKEGESIKLYTGMRTKACELLTSVRVVRVSTITITTSDRGSPRIAINADLVSHDRAMGIARKDGFETLEAFTHFFSEQHGLPFSGYLIEW